MSYVAVETTTAISANGIVLVSYPDTINAKVGSTITITVELQNTDSVDHGIYIKILDENGNELASTTDTLSSGTTKKYDLQVTAPTKVSSFTWTLEFGVTS